MKRAETGFLDHSLVCCGTVHQEMTFQEVLKRVQCERTKRLTSRWEKIFDKAPIP